MTASSLKPQLRHALLRKLSAKQSGKKNWLQKGFTLVELMIVIVIVGILSAIALPNFLSQSSKAKITEPLGKASAALKQAQSIWVEKGTFTGVTCPDVGITGTGGLENDWTYTCTGSGDTFKVDAAGSGANKNLNLTDCAINGPTGIITACTKDVDASS
ncbi:type IV pilin protein [Synechococcus sp. W4D4]|uniref:type IV pilin protein n=1 Tax=Synechococcus sp. W4D4 TaxID=3392294 RepID=UPI0039EAA289